MPSVSGPLERSFVSGFLFFLHELAPDSMSEAAAPSLPFVVRSWVRARRAVTSGCWGSLCCVRSRGRIQVFKDLVEAQVTCGASCSHVAGENSRKKGDRHHLLGDVHGAPGVGFRSQSWSPERGEERS